MGRRTVSDFFWAPPSTNQKKGKPADMSSGFTGRFAVSQPLENNSITVEIMAKLEINDQATGSASKDASLVNAPKFVVLGRKSFTGKELLTLMDNSQGEKSVKSPISLIIPIPKPPPKASSKFSRVADKEKGKEEVEEAAPVEIKRDENMIDAEVTMLLDYEAVDDLGPEDRDRQRVKLRMLGLKDIALSSVQALISRNQRRGPRIGCGVTVGNAASAVGEDVINQQLCYSVIWNGQELFHSLPLQPTDKNDTSECSHLVNDELTLYVPLNCRVSQCRLQVGIWHEQSLLATGCIEGRKLARFLERSESGKWISLYSCLRPKLNAFATPSDASVVSGASAIMNDTFTKIAEVKLSGALSAFLATAERQHRSKQVESQSKSKPKVVILTISTGLTHKQRGWQFFFNALTQSMTTFAETNARAIVVKKKSPPAGNTAPDGSEGRNKMERAGAIQLKRASKVSDTDRVTWRGRVAPKHLIIAPVDGGKEQNAEADSLMNSLLFRTAKLFKIQPITKMKVVADIFHIKIASSDGVERKEGELPVIVKEGLSTGPGLITGTYRIEVYGNNNVVLGATEVKDDRDLQLVVGEAGRHFFVGKKRDDWDLGAIFEYIVRERFILEMLPMVRTHNSKPSLSSGCSRREGVSVKTGENHGGSNVQLIRDSPESVFGLEDSHSSIKLDGGSVSDASQERKVYWTRITARTHKLAGNLLRTFVLLQGHNSVLQATPDKYFLRLDSLSALRELNLIVRVTDKKLSLHSELKLTGLEVVKWLPPEFPLDLSSKFKRKLLGNLIIEGMCLHFDTFGKYTIDLANPELTRRFNGDRLLGSALDSSWQGGKLGMRKSEAKAKRPPKEDDFDLEEVENEDDDDDEDDEADDDATGDNPDADEESLGSNDQQDPTAGAAGALQDLTASLTTGLGGIASDVVGRLASLF